MNEPTLYLIPTTLGECSLDDVLPQKIKEVIEHCNHFIVENEKTARRFIKKICPEKSQSELILFPLNKHTPKEDLMSFLQPCKEGFSVGILSEAGCPAVADPGSEMVSLAHRNSVRVMPLVGPSSVLLSVMASGLGGQNFAFNGYLPIDKSERKSTLKRLEKRAKDENQSQIFIETPYRNEKLFQEMLQVLQKDTQICVACDVTLPTEFIRTFSVFQWQKQKTDLHKRPTIFIIGR